MRRTPILVFLIALVLVASTCRRMHLSPEEQVRKAIEVVVNAVGERNIKPVAASVSEQYADRNGNDKKQIVSLVRMQFLLHPNLYLVTKITSVECPEPIQSHVVLYAAMASLPTSVQPDLRNLSADVYRFDITLVDENGTWRVCSAAWAPATVKDLL